MAMAFLDNPSKSSLNRTGHQFMAVLAGLSLYLYSHLNTEKYSPITLTNHLGYGPALLYLLGPPECQ
jgi:hypothetical protein